MTSVSASQVFPVFAQGLVLSLGLIVAIGAQNAFVLRQGLQRRYVGMVVMACMGADIALILAGVGGMGALVLQWPLLLQVLRFGGAAVGSLQELRALRPDRLPARRRPMSTSGPSTSLPKSPVMVRAGMFHRFLVPSGSSNSTSKPQLWPFSSRVRAMISRGEHTGRASPSSPE